MSQKDHSADSDHLFEGRYRPFCVSIEFWANGNGPTGADGRIRPVQKTPLEIGRRDWNPQLSPLQSGGVSVRSVLAVPLLGASVGSSRQRVISHRIRFSFVRWSPPRVLAGARPRPATNGVGTRFLSGPPGSTDGVDSHIDVPLGTDPITVGSRESLSQVLADELGRSRVGRPGKDCRIRSCRRGQTFLQVHDGVQDTVGTAVVSTRHCE